MAKEILIAGATGWVGQQIAGAVLRRGGKARLMVRDGTDEEKVAALAPLTEQGAEIVYADVASGDGLNDAVTGVDVIVSALQGGPEVIVDGQRALAEAGLAAGVSRIFPSDFSVDFRQIDDDEHVFLGWRRKADRAISEVGLPQTNTFNGAFTEMLAQPFLGLIDWQNSEVTYWGEPGQPYDFTTTGDTAQYVAAAALDDTIPDGAFSIAGDVASPDRLVDILSQVTGRAFRLRPMGSLEALSAEIAKRRDEHPSDPMVWAALQYHLVMASGRGKIQEPLNARYPDIIPTSIEAFLKQERVRG